MNIYFRLIRFPLLLSFLCLSVGIIGCNNGPSKSATYSLVGTGVGAGVGAGAGALSGALVGLYDDSRDDARRREREQYHSNQRERDYQQYRD